MAHFTRVVKGRILRKTWRQYLLSKRIGVCADDHKSESSSTSQKSERRRKCCPHVQPVLIRVYDKFRKPDSIERVFLESFLGFVGGVIMTYALFVFFHIGVNISAWTSTCICTLVGAVLCFGLAFSSGVRCYVLLLLPVFFSKEGRQALLTYALFLSFTGPGRNTMHNMEVLSDSMACGQEMVKRTLREVLEMNAPDREIRESMDKVMRAVQEVVDSMRAVVMKVKRLVIDILNVLKRVRTWLKGIVTFCNRKFGTPFQRCVGAFDEAIADCKARLSPVNCVCHLGYILQAFCCSVKCLDFFCWYSECVSDAVIDEVKKGLRNFHNSVKNLLNVSVEMKHSYEAETTVSVIPKLVGRTLLQKLSKKMEKLQTIFSFFGFVFSLFFLFLFMKVYYYRYKYFSSDKYDNVYISNYIVELDVQRAQSGRETVLPLEPRERNYFAKPTSIRLLRNEMSRIAESLFLLSLTSFKIITFLVVDYSLFWILMTVYEAGRNGIQEVEETKVVFNVRGNGMLAEFYQRLGKTLQVPKNPNLRLSRLHCLPDPFRPDTRRYIQIGFLVILCWLLTVTEAYGLRLRHIIMSHYYPDRARERALWLYNHIIRSRSSFIRYARRGLRRKFGGLCPTQKKIILAERPFAEFPLLRSLFGKNKENCLICKSQCQKQCRMPGCRGRYCLSCFACLGNICTVCQHPLEYGDVSDMSEEIDSSEDSSEASEEKSSKCVSETESEDQQFMTFQDMETRDSFKDVEANRVPDYAKLGDLYTDKAALQRRLKVVIQKHLENIERGRMEALEKEQNVRQRLRDVVCNKLKNKKLEQMRTKKSAVRKKKFLEKIHILKALRKSVVCEEEVPSSSISEPTKSKVSFKSDVADSEIAEETLRSNYRRLKEELRAKIEAIKERRNLNSENSNSNHENLA